MAIKTQEHQALVDICKSIAKETTTIEREDIITRGGREGLSTLLKTSSRLSQGF